MSTQFSSFSSLVALHTAAKGASKDGIWACVFFIGMAVSLIFPCAFIWVHTRLARLCPEGGLSVVVMLTSALAGIMNPLLLGLFFQQVRLFMYNILFNRQ